MTIKHATAILAALIIFIAIGQISVGGGWQFYLVALSGLYLLIDSLWTYGKK